MEEICGLKVGANLMLFNSMDKKVNGMDKDQRYMSLIQNFMTQEKWARDHSVTCLMLEKDIKQG